jgi:hypothetical protein
MSKIKLERNFVGAINIPDGIVNVTDPCYDGDVWCRMTTKVKPGKYNCYSYIGDDNMWGKRVWINQIVIADNEYSAIAEERILSGKSWRKIGTIGVDAGMAGFFNHKPNFNDEEWSELCDWLFEEAGGGLHNPNDVYGSFIRHFATGDGFWTNSGCGDGSYTVHAIRENRKIIALEIRF